MRINTREEAANIVEMFEDVLDRYNITVPSPEDEDRDPDNDARLFGSTYYELLDLVEEKLLHLLLDYNPQHGMDVGYFSGSWVDANEGKGGGTVVDFKTGGVMQW